MAEDRQAEAGLGAEDWLKMWEGGFSHDHGEHAQHAQDGGEGHSSHEHEDDCGTDEHLKRNVGHFTNNDTAKTIFVSLCGNSPAMEWLCNMGYSVVGAELSELAVKKIFEESKAGAIPFNVITDGNLKIYSATDNKKLKVYVGNFFESDFNRNKLGTFDCIWDSHGIISIPVPQQEAYASKLITFLKPGGKILFSIVDYDITKLKKGPAPAPISASRLQQLFPQCGVELLENPPLPGGELEGVDEWSNPVVLVTLS